jgi:capsular exopolysaccharide synthesis family protein
MPPEFSQLSEPDAIPLSAYWNILVKNRRSILAISLFVFAAGSYCALSATTVYTAAATIKIEPQNPRVTGIEELQSVDLRAGDYDYYQTQFALLKSRPLAARVITELRLASNNSFTTSRIVSPNPINHLQSWIARLLGFASYYVLSLVPSTPATSDSQPVDSLSGSAKAEGSNSIKGEGLELKVAPTLIAQYLGFVGVSPVSKTRLVRVEMTTPDPALSQTLANAHVYTFMRMNLEDRFSLTHEAREFLEQKKNELQRKLERAEAELNKFRRAHGVLSVEKGENIVVDRLMDLNKQLTTARAQRIEAESLYRTVENRNYQDLTDVMKQGLVQQLKSDLAALEAQKARTAAIFKPDHPRIQEFNQQIAAAREALKNEVANVVRGIRSNYAAALAKERALENEAEKQQRDALKLKETGVQYTVLQEEVNANRSLYESVLKRLSETNVSNDLAVSNMQIVERASKPLGSSGPNVPIYLLASVFSGLLLGVGAAFLREFLDSTVGSTDKVWRSVGLGTLGVVPHLKFLDRASHNRWQIRGPDPAAQLPISRVPAKELITNHGPLSIMNEAYRTIRTSLLLSQAEKPPQVILLTSPLPGEGKTVTSLNLAIALARDGRNVLLVDADMRKGCCHNRLGLPNNRGLSNVLTGGLSLQEGIQETSVSGLSLLSRGVPPPNPTELLGSRRMKEILGELRQWFEFILIDCSPVVAISDAAILSVATDGVLLVFDAQTTSTVHAQKAVDRLDTVRARLLGVILNAVNLDNPDYSYYRTYSHYYQASNGHEEPDSQNTEESDESVTILNNTENRNGSRKTFRVKNVGEMTNRLVHSVQDYVYKGSNEKDQEKGESNRPKGDYDAKLSDHESSGETNEWATSTGAVSQALMNRLIDVFTEAVGPLGALLIREQIDRLGESQQAFPTSRLDELVESIEPEILHPDIRARFHEKIAAELRNLKNC